MDWIKSDWWASLNNDEQILWMIAWVFSILWFIRNLMVSTSSEEEEPEVLSYQPSFYRYSAGSLITAMALWGWSSALTYSLSHWAPVVVGLGSLLVVFMWEQISRYRSEQRLRAHVQEQMNKPVAVKASIPAARQGVGKIAFGEEDKMIVLDALTNGPSLHSGAIVKIKEIIGSNLIRVEINGT